MAVVRHERKFKRHSQIANYKSMAAGWNGAKFRNFATDEGSFVLAKTT
jgi:hypothetical protein